MEPSVFQVNLTGILKILSDSLYSQKEVFVRELLQNSIDAIKARKQKESFEPYIRVDYYQDEQGKGLVLSDNGIGLTRGEVEEFLSKIGSSSKSSDILSNQSGDFIGQFGIGLLSCFMVSNEIVVKTQVQGAANLVKWVGNINGTYQTTVEAPQEGFVGTRVILKLRTELDLSPSKIQHLLELYGTYLSLPIHYEVNGRHEATIGRSFPWEDKQNGDSILNFGRTVFQQNFSNYIELTDRTGQSKGVAYILPHAVHFASIQNNHVYIKNMFISNQAQDLVPEWAFFVRVVVNSKNLAPTASREEIYKNETAKEVQEDFGNCIKNYLKKLSVENPEQLSYILKTHSNALKSLALADNDFLTFIANWFVLPTTEGEYTIKQIKAKSKTILFVPDLDEFRQLVPIARANGKLVINAGYIYDTELLERLKQQDSTSFYQRIDVNYFGNILQDLDLAEYDLYASKVEMLQENMAKFDCELELKQFLPADIPAIFHLSQETLKNRDLNEIKDDSNALWSSITGSLFEEEKSYRSKLFLNFKNPIVQKIVQGANVQEKLFLETIYINAMLMGHYPLNQLELDTMNQNLLLLLNQ
jgi:molecular chaperone HtpG